MTCTFPDKLACDRLVCRIDGCREFWKLDLDKTERLLEERLGLPEYAKHDYIGQLVRKPKDKEHCDNPKTAKKQSISDEAMEALAAIFEVPIAYLYLETADHGLSEEKRRKNVLKRIAALQRETQEMIDPRIGHRRDGDQHAAREQSEGAGRVIASAQMYDRDAEAYDEPVHYDDDDETLQNYGKFLRSIVEQSRGREETTPVESLVRKSTNPLGHAAVQWRSKNPASRKTAVFGSRIVDGEWRVSVADLAPDQRPLLKTGADDKLYALTHPADRPIAWIPAGASLLFETCSSLCPGDWIVTLQPTDQQIDEMFTSPEAIYFDSNRDMKLRPIWSVRNGNDPPAPREFRVGMWRYVGQHCELNSMRVAPVDRPDDDEVIICYDQLWLAVLKGFIR